MPRKGEGAGVTLLRACPGKENNTKYMQNRIKVNNNEGKSGMINNMICKDLAEDRLLIGINTGK